MKSLKKFIASVKNKENKIIIIEGEYKFKKDFVSDLRGNGYRIRFITTEENFNKACEDYYWKLETQKNIQREIRASRKKYNFY